MLSERLVGVTPGRIQTECVYTGAKRLHGYENLVAVTGRTPQTDLYDSLRDMDPSAHGVESVRRVGDCLVPSSIADAVYAGHLCGRELDEPTRSRQVRRERAELQ